MTMMPANVLYHISENDLENLIIKALEKGFERGQKKPIEKPLTKQEAADYLRVHVTTFEARIRNRKLPLSLRHINGGTTYFFASELEAFIKKS